MAYTTKRYSVSTDEPTLTAYLRAASAKGKAAMREKRERGETMHPAPLGWLNARDEEGRSVMIRDPDRHELLLEARDLWNKDVSLRRICSMLDKKGFRIKRGRPISPASLWHGIKAAGSPRCELDREKIQRRLSKPGSDDAM